MLVSLLCLPCSFGITLPQEHLLFFLFFFFDNTWQFLEWEEHIVLKLKS